MKARDIPGMIIVIAWFALGAYMFLWRMWF